jgi:pimeloyl-ACP methyl ester carboxylesterase
MGKILLCLIVFTLTGCDLGQNILYPLKEANEVAVPDLPPPNYSQQLLPVIHPDGDMLVHFWYFEQNASSAPVLLFFHGQGENIANPRIAALLKNFENSGCHFVLMDYPGYGKSTGVPSQSTILADANVVFSWIQSHFKKSKIFIFGWSLGSAVAAQATALHQNDLSGFILASPWTSLSELIESYGFGLPPGDWILKNKWDSEDAARKTNVPGLIVHGDADTTIPFELGVKLAAAYAQINFIPVAGVDHVGTVQSAELWNAIRDFTSK